MPAKQSTLAAKPVEQPYMLANQSMASEQLQMDELNSVIETD